MAGRLYGYECSTAVLDVYHINQASDFDYVFSEYVSPTSLFSKFILYRILPYLIFVWAGLKYDIFHFYFDGGILKDNAGSRFELQLLRMSGKKVIATPYGGDARCYSDTIRYLYNFCMDCTPATKTCNEDAIRKNVDYVCRYADVILACADIVDTLPRHEGMWLYPIDLAEWVPANALNKEEPLKVVHASNHRKYKGTRFLIEAIEEMRSEGHPIELILVEGLPNREARKCYEKADIIADQFIGGAYALFAIEGMALGKPVLCYLREDLFAYHPEWDNCPIVNTSPIDIKMQLTRLMLDPGLRQELGAKGITYVQKYHSLESVGRTLDEFYRKLWFK
jgi:glycosyltransferase involved in cell wall biosynthesis